MLYSTFIINNLVLKNIKWQIILLFDKSNRAKYIYIHYSLSFSNLYMRLLLVFLLVIILYILPHRRKYYESLSGSRASTHRKSSSIEKKTELEEVYDIGWYRKEFLYDSAWNGKRIFLEFDGIYRDVHLHVAEPVYIKPYHTAIVAETHGAASGGLFNAVNIVRGTLLSKSDRVKWKLLVLFLLYAVCTIVSLPSVLGKRGLKSNQ